MSPITTSQPFAIPTDHASNGSNGKRSWLDHARERFLIISTIPANWDSYGADAPFPELLRAAWDVAVRLASIADLPCPYINPTRAGGVTFEWEVEPRYFSLDVEDESLGKCFFQDETARFEDEYDLPLSEPLDSAVEHIRRVGPASSAERQP